MNAHAPRPSGPAPLLVLTHEFFPFKGGIAVYTEEMARAAAALGKTVEVWAPKRRELEAASFPFPVRPLQLRGSQSWPCRIRLARAILANKERFRDAVIYLPEPGAIRTFLYLQYCGLPHARSLVLTLHGSEILRFTSAPHRRFLFGRLLRRCERVGVVSEHIRELLLDIYPWADEKTRLVPGALRSDFHASVHVEKKPGDRLILLTVGRVHPRKGQHALIEALELLPRDLKQQVEYWIAGPVIRREYQTQLERAAARCGVPVRFLGEVADAELPGLYRKADIFAMTSLPRRDSIEGFGLVYLEAAACGLPVLGHHTGGVAEAVRHGETGLLAPHDDRPVLADLLGKLIYDPSLRRNLALNGRRRVEALSWKRNVEQLFGAP